MVSPFFFFVFFNGWCSPLVIPDDICFNSQVTIAAAPLQVESGEELRPVMLQVGHRRIHFGGLGLGTEGVYFSTKKKKALGCQLHTTNPKDQLSGQLILFEKTHGIRQFLKEGILWEIKRCVFSAMC